jgi:Peptidase family M28
MNLPASPSGRACRDVVLAAMLVTLCRVVPAHCLAAATGASSHISNSGVRASLAADPVVDGAYVQAQLAYLVTRDPRREAGQDTDLPRARNGHDEFAADWLAALRSDLHGLPLRVARQTFRLPGFRGRPPKTPGVNLIVTVPGTTRPREWVLLVAHYDGTPFTTQSAFDDGSGCAILLGVARAMAPLWRLHRPARTVAFVLFDGEEQGLIGSFSYARVYRQGAPYRIVALYNEEQNGVGYPIRPFGLATNPTLPEHVFVTPQRHGSRWTPPTAPRFWPALRRFTAALVRARERAFAALHAVYPQLSYRPALSTPVFRHADEDLVPVGDDTIGGSDEVPFEHLGLPTVTFVSNYDYYARHHHPWSYPYDSARDTMALLERTATGAAQPSSALAAALALPGQLTVAMLRDRTWGSDVGLA